MISYKQNTNIICVDCSGCKTDFNNNLPHHYVPEPINDIKDISTILHQPKCTILNATHYNRTEPLTSDFFLRKELPHHFQHPKFNTPTFNRTMRWKKEQKRKIKTTYGGMLQKT